MGDPAGIGLDITLTAWHERTREALAPFVLFGDPEALAARARTLGLEVPIALVSDPAAASDVFADRLPVWPIATAAPVRAGMPEVANAAAAVAAIEEAVRCVKRGQARALVTNPIAKAVLQSGGFKHPGHTEFLGALAQSMFGALRAKPVMLLASPELRVVPLTVHIPLIQVAAAISENAILETARILDAALRSDFGIGKPRIAVAGLNPHAGEGGTIGDEDERIVRPAVVRLASEGLSITGPWPADTLFHDAARGNYDAVLAMYHDQALIPIKTLAFDTGVNVTIGLPFVRTSPDHGTAFALAGTGKARARSLIEALKLADTLAARREDAQATRP
jgi:4-hydroxythreonine-4-phosphate dehydrogenase